MIKKLLELFGFTFGQLQDIATLLKHLENNSVSVESFIDYVEEKKFEAAKIDKDIKERLRKQQEKWEQHAFKCPECKIAMNLQPVNTGPRDQTGDDSKSVWTCPKCWHEEFSEKTITEQLQESRTDPKNGSLLGKEIEK